MERHDFDSRTPNFFMFKKGGVNYCLKEASTASVTVSADYRLSTCDLEIDETNESRPVKTKTLGNRNEADLMLLERNIYVCDKDHPDDPLKAKTLVDPAVVRGWEFETGKFLGDKLDEMSGLAVKKDPPGEAGKAKKEHEARLGKS